MGGRRGWHSGAPSDVCRLFEAAKSFDQETHEFTEQDFLLEWDTDRIRACKCVLFTCVYSGRCVCAAIKEGSRIPGAPKADF